jgi:hypothetical protein
MEILILLPYNTSMQLCELSAEPSTPSSIEIAKNYTFYS